MRARRKLISMLDDNAFTRIDYTIILILFNIIKYKQFITDLFEHMYDLLLLIKEIKTKIL